MSMPDTFRFSQRLEMFPAGLPRDGWTTRDLDSALMSYWVDHDGRVARKIWSDSGETGYCYSDSACFLAYLQQRHKEELVTLKIQVESGYLKSVLIEQPPEDTEVDEPAWRIPATGPDDEDD